MLHSHLVLRMCVSTCVYTHRTRTRTRTRTRRDHSRMLGTGSSSARLMSHRAEGSEAEFYKRRGTVKFQIQIGVVVTLYVIKLDAGNAP